MRDLDTREEIWVNLDEYDVKNESGDEKREKIDIIEGEEIYFCEEKECESNRVKQDKEKELNSWKENEVYTEIEWKEGMKVVNARCIITEKENRQPSLIHFLLT